MPPPLRVLIVEDEPAFADLLCTLITAGGYDLTWKRVERAAEMRAALGREPWDLVLSDYQLPRFSAAGALQILKESGLDLPLIVITSSGGEEVAVEAMRAGAHDYLLKTNLTRLVPAIEREVREAEGRRARRRAEELLSYVSMHARCLLWHARVRLDERGAGGVRWDIEVSDQRGAQRFLPLRLRRGERYEEAWLRSKLAEDRTRMDALSTSTLQSGERCYSQEFRCRRADGELQWLFEDVHIEPLGEGEWRLVGVCTDITRQKRTEEELRALSARLQAAREEERSQIAREVHDDLGQMLSCLKMDLTWLAQRLPARELLLHAKAKNLLAMVDEMVASVRRIATELRPAILDTLGLAAAIEWQIAEFAQRTGIRCATSWLEDLSLSDEGSIAVFRIVQEALANVARHSGATRLRISLAQANGMAVLTFRDNGRGITGSEAGDPGAIGIAGMRERASLAGGEVAIEGVPGKGTTVTVRIPLEETP